MVAIPTDLGKSLTKAIKEITTSGNPKPQITKCTPSKGGCYAVSFAVPGASTVTVSCDPNKPPKAGWLKKELRLG